MSTFSVIKEEKKNKKATPTVEEYYYRLGRRVSVFRYICLLLTAAFVVSSFAFRGNELTIENFRYMLRFIDFGAEETIESAYVAFDGNDSNVGGIFKGDVAVLSDDGLIIYGWDGGKILTSSFSYNHPAMEASSKTLICYDLGGRDYTVFNSYTAVYSPSKPLDYPIYSLSLSENGNYAVVSSEKSYRSGVYVYDSADRLVYYHLFGDKYVESVDMNDNGDGFVTAAYYSEKGELVTLLMRFALNEEEAKSTLTFTGEMPLKTEFFSDGSYALLTDKAIRFFSPEDECVNTTLFEEKSLFYYEFSENRVIIAFKVVSLSGGTEATVYQKDGSEVLTREYDGAVSDMRIIGDTMYTLTPSLLTVTDLTGAVKDEEITLSKDVCQLLENDGKLILFAKLYAEVYKNNEEVTSK